MTSKKTAIIVSLTMVLMVGGIIGYAIVSSSSDTSTTNNTTTRTTPETTSNTPDAVTQGTNSTLGVSTLGGGSLGLQSNLGGQSGGSSESSASSSAGSSSAVPGPESYSQYEQYKDKDTAMFMDIVTGKGTEVAADSKVQVTYKGWLTNGTLFDQSPVNDKGQTEAFSFVVGAHTVIPGWEQAIVGMKVGGTRRMIVPPVVGYGAEGKAPVPPNALMVFDVTLHAAL